VGFAFAIPSVDAVVMNGYSVGFVTVLDMSLASVLLLTTVEVVNSLTVLSVNMSLALPRKKPVLGEVIVENTGAEVNA
jgi:hypothetical protein